MLVLLFDFTRLRQEDAEGSANPALRWIDDAMAATDLVAVVTIGPDLRVVNEFTSDREALRATLQSPAVRKGAAQPAADTTAAAMRGIGRVCETIEPVARRKAVLYFSAGVNARNDGDQAAELREVARACDRANASLYPVDARGQVSANGLMRTDPAT
jgi:VWFA-related protein